MTNHSLLFELPNPPFLSYLSSLLTFHRFISLSTLPFTEVIISRSLFPSGQEVKHLPPQPPHLAMEPRTVFFLLSLSSLFYCTAAACVNISGIKRRMFPAQVTPPSCTIEMTVQAICNHTDNPDLCASSIKPYLPSSGDVFPVDVLRMEIKACASYTNITIGVAAKLANDRKTPRGVVGCLQVCQENYVDALYNLQSADDAIRANDSGMLNSMLSAAMTDYETCEDTFAEEPGRRSPMASYDDTLSKLASNCLAVSELI